MINRRYKDSLFRLVFKDKKELLGLYNALNDSDYTDESLLTVTTIEDIVYINVKNDLSFMISATLNLYEHQSSANPNMPLRGVLYFAKLYQQFIDMTEANIFGSRRVELPTPKYLVFCNYEGMKEERIQLRLSDSFVIKQDSDYSLECMAELINVNAGHNQELMKKCRKLYEYSLFVEKMRELPRKCKNQDELEEQIDQVMKECIENDILSDILRKHYSEVHSMFLEGVDMEKYVSLMVRDAREDAIAEGKVEAKIEDILELLLELGEVPEKLQTRISEEKDLEVLRKWHRLAARCESVTEFEEKM